MDINRCIGRPNVPLRLFFSKTSVKTTGSTCQSNAMPILDFPGAGCYSPFTCGACSPLLAGAWLPQPAARLSVTASPAADHPGPALFTSGFSRFHSEMLPPAARAARAGHTRFQAARTCLSCPRDRAARPILTAPTRPSYFFAFLCTVPLVHIVKAMACVAEPPHCSTQRQNGCLRLENVT